MARPPALPQLPAGLGRRGQARARARLAERLAAGQEHPERGRERLGETDRARPDGALIWLHGADDADLLDLLALAERLRLERDDLAFLLTTSRYGGGDPLSGLLAPGCIHQFLPYDEGDGMARFLDHWAPDLCIWGEAGLRRRVIEEVARRDLPLYWVNAEMPDNIHHRMRWFPGQARRLLRAFERIHVIDGRSAHNMRRLGAAAERLEITGRLQDAPPPLECDEAARADLSRVLATRPVWLAGNIADCEERMVLDAHRTVSRHAHMLLLVLSPDDPQQGGDLARRLEREGWIVTRRSEGLPGNETQILLADLPGEAGLWFRLAPTSYLGRTMPGCTGQPCDPMQAAALGSAILHGPRTGIHARRFARLDRAGAAREVHDTASLSAELEALLAPNRAAEMARAAWEVSTAGAEATDQLCEQIIARLDELGV